MEGITTSPSPTSRLRSHLSRIHVHCYEEPKRLCQKEVKLKYCSAGTSYMQIDVWMPKYLLCFEFQDSYHYTPVWYYNSPQEHIQNKDSEKQEVAVLQGMSLIVVPCWWDSSVESLVSTILFQRPDMGEYVPCYKQLPICLNPPRDLFKQMEIPDVGELMVASFQLLGRFHLDFSCFNWWIGEKYDGMRSCWNPSERKLYPAAIHYCIYSRHGRELTLAPIFSHLPKLFVDNEIWFGRGQFSSTYSLVNEEAHIPWPLRIISFDIPAVECEDFPFEKRYEQLLTTFPANHPITIIAPRMKCEDEEKLEMVLETIVRGGGEGVILQQFGSKYLRGKSSILFKLKSFEDEKEAILVGIGEDNSVLLKLPDGSTFTVSADDVHVPNLKIGDVVTFLFERNSRSDAPTNARIYRIRSDLSWDDVVQSFQNDRQYSKEAPEESEGGQQREYWTPRNMRAYMESYARSRNLDPLLPETWYSSFTGFSHSRNGKMILGKFKSEYFVALKNLFPEVTFESSKFQQSMWSKIENRRKFFESYAAERGFDPLSPTHWYLQSKAQIMSEKGTQTIVLYHNNSLASALTDLFPNIGLDLAKLKSHLSVWHDPAKRIRFFIQYAAVNEFDPNDANQWYAQPIDRILSSQGAKHVILHHGGSIAQSLLDLFPDIGLDASKLQLLSVWHSIEAKRRRFFDKYAQTQGFDPLIADNWYSQTRSKILSLKGAARVMSYYSNSITKALLHLYPEINLIPTRLYKSLSPWGSEERRRRFFETYAKQNQFDPLVPDKWYLLSKEVFLTAKGARGALFHHGGSLAKALTELFPEIGLVYSKFKSTHSTVWNDPERQRRFFLNYAREHGFDPLNPNDWYRQSKRDIFTKTGARRIAHYHGASITQALLHLFPNIGFDENKLRHRKRNG